MSFVDRTGQVWLYRYMDGSIRVCLIVRSDELDKYTTCHHTLDLDFSLKPSAVGKLGFAFEGSLNRHWERVA